MLDNIFVVDIEGNSLNPTKLHVISIGRKVEGKWQITSYTDYPSMVRALKEIEEVGGVCLGHNFYRFDIVVLEKLLKTKFNFFIIDTLILSWYLEPDLLKHGLEHWGEALGHAKVQIDDWENLPLETYVERCSTDVLINSKLWDLLYRKLNKLYDNNQAHIEYVIRYWMFKMRVTQLQEKSRWKADVPRIHEYLTKFQAAKDKKIEELLLVMPKVEVKKIITKPSKPYRKDGSLSVAGEKYLALAVEQGYPPDFESSPDELSTSTFKDPNPNSVGQIKQMLYDLGWIPETFKFERNKETGEVKKKPQLYLEDKTICPSIQKLYDKKPELEVIEGLGVISNRIGTLKGFLRDLSEDGYLTARISSITNTGRVIHKELVNLPKVLEDKDKTKEVHEYQDGKYIRGCLTAPEGYELCGFDVEGLEEQCKKHYMYPLDPEYVMESSAPGYDPHLSLAVFAGALRTEQMLAHINKTESHKGVRDTYKTINYQCIYGAGVEAIARATKKSLKEAKKLHEAYWGKNWAVKEIAKNAKVKECLGTKWIWNPVSKLWYSLRYDKDRFSTLNQSTGVFCFDTILKFLLEARPQISGSYHDEGILQVRLNHREQCKELLNEVIEKANNQLKLNVPLKIDVKFGSHYDLIH